MGPEARIETSNGFEVPRQMWTAPYSPSVFDGVVHGGLHPAPCGVQVVCRRRRPQRLLLQRRHRVVAAHPRVVVQRRLLKYGFINSFIWQH